MTTVATTASRTVIAAKTASTSGKPGEQAIAGTKATAATGPSSAKVGNATVISLTNAAKSYITNLPIGADTSSIWNSGAFATGT